MARQHKAFSKIEPDFLLGDTDAGKRFLKLSEANQLYYIRLWNYCIRHRVLKISNSNEILNKFAGGIFISPLKFKRLKSEILKNKLAQINGDGTYTLKGIKELHGLLRWVATE